MTIINVVRRQIQNIFVESKRFCLTRFGNEIKNRAMKDSKDLAQETGKTVVNYIEIRKSVGKIGTDSWI